MTEAERDLLIAIAEILAPRLDPAKPLHDQFALLLERVKAEDIENSLPHWG